MRDMVTERRMRGGRMMHTIVGGTPSWRGQDIEACQKLMDRIGLRAFLREAQHEVHRREGALEGVHVPRHQGHDDPRARHGESSPAALPSSAAPSISRAAPVIAS